MSMFPILVAAAAAQTGGGAGSSLPKPAFNPPGGMFENHPTALIVAITTSKSGATMRYTTDETEPTLLNGTLISGVSGSASMPRNTETTLKAVTIFSGQLSNVTTGVYAVTDGDA